MPALLPLLSFPLLLLPPGLSQGVQRRQNERLSARQEVEELLL